MWLMEIPAEKLKARKKSHTHQIASSHAPKLLSFVIYCVVANWTVLKQGKRERKARWTNDPVTYLIFNIRSSCYVPVMMNLPNPNV